MRIGEKADALKSSGRDRIKHFEDDAAVSSLPITLLVSGNEYSPKTELMFSTALSAFDAYFVQLFATCYVLRIHASDRKWTAGKACAQRMQPVTNTNNAQRIHKVRFGSCPKLRRVCENKQWRSSLLPKTAGNKVSRRNLCSYTTLTVSRWRFLKLQDHGSSKSARYGACYLLSRRMAALS